MNVRDFIREVRYRRGRLESSEKHLRTIFEFGTQSLIDFTVNDKAIGVENISDIAKMSTTEQDEFCKWFYSHTPRPNRDSIDLYLAGKLPKQGSLF